MSFVRRVAPNTVLLTLAAVAWLAINLRWLVVYRHRNVLDIDEAGYLGIALNDYGAAMRGGVAGWFEAVTWPGIQAPLTPALASLQFLVTGPRTLLAFGIPLVAILVTVLISYALAKRVGDGRIALACLLLLATSPAMIHQARSFHFGAVSAAVTTAAVYALVRSDRMRHPGWSLAFGGFVGLMPLSRTMTIAFVPGLLLVALVQGCLGPDRRRRLLWFLASVVVAVGVAALWLGKNGAAVFRYLTGFGYGNQAAEFGDKSGLLDPAAWLARVSYVADDQYLPHALILGAGMIAALIVVVGRTRRLGARAYGAAALRSPLLIPAGLLAFGMAALVSSRNGGTQFALPLIPALVILAVWGLNRVSVRVARATPIAVAVVAVIAFVPQVDLRLPTADHFAVGPVTVTDGRGAVHIYVGRGENTSETEPVSPSEAVDWIAAADWAADQIIIQDQLAKGAGLGFRDRLLNTNTVQLAVLRKKGYGIALPQIAPTDVGNTGAGYERWLTQPGAELSGGDGSKVCLLFTATGTVNEFPPAIDPAAMTGAARKAGFTPIANRPLPNGREMTLWRRGGNGC